MGEDRYPRRVYEDRHRGQSPRGRRSVTWMNNIRTSLHDRGVNWRQARKIESSGVPLEKPLTGKVEEETIK
ncbi:hypothetical protein ANN_16197 [Periplaneta americana]|uniref:Uncharacterized protein n=1 Tax=Periplaneta americana TaxID=6978 RepID=A0ABQ8SIB2_PERAM|nr:hypothetical protein ANN_16197 [Periplaneta americana]